MIPAWNSSSPSFSPDTRRVFLCVLDRRQSTKSLRWINKCHYLYNEKTCWAWCLAPNHHHASPLLERQTPLGTSRRGFSLINCLVAIWWKACAESPGGRGGNERQGSSWRDERHRQRIINMSALNLDFFFFLETDLIALMRVVKLAAQCFSVGFRCDSCTGRILHRWFTANETQHSWSSPRLNPVSCYSALKDYGGLEDWEPWEPKS